MRRHCGVNVFSRRCPAGCKRWCVKRAVVTKDSSVKRDCNHVSRITHYERYLTMSDSILSIGVIGTGGMGGRHARNLALRTPGVRVVALMDIDEVRAAEVAAICGGATIYTDGKALIADPDVQAVVIASPDSTHAALALACIEAGKPALCEKPLASSVADAENVLQAELATGRRLLQLGFMREYDPAHRAVKEAVTEGSVGRPLLFRGLHTNVNRNGVARSIEDVIINSAIHDIHSARWLLNDEISSVYVEHIPVTAEQPRTCRLALLQLTGQNGSIAVIEMNADAGYGYEVAVEMVGELGTVGSNGLAGPLVRREQTLAQTIDYDLAQAF